MLEPLLKQAGELPSLPEVYIRVTELLETESATGQKLGVTHIDVGVALLEKWGIPGLITQCVRKHHHTDHIGPFAIETSIVYLANKLSRLDLSNEEDVIEDVLSIIPNWEKSNCTAEQITIACSLADEQWLEVMESLGMVDLDIDAELEEAYLFNTDLDKL
jgi:HD-like signal output (HDOD) protein